MRITPAKDAKLVVAGQGVVGLAFASGRDVILATNNAIYRLTWDVQGRVLASPEM